MSGKLRNILYILLWAGSFFIFGKRVMIARAAEKGDVVINEIMWMGSGKKMGSDKYSQDDEWIELKNMTGAEIDIADWQITKLMSGKEVLMLTMPEGKNISANGYFLIANYGKGAESVLNIEPDLADTDVSLVNSDLQIKLYNGDWTAGAFLIDVADDGSGAPLAGKHSNGEKIYFSMERNDITGDGTLEKNWRACSLAVNLIEGAIECGTPRYKNSIGAVKDGEKGGEGEEGENSQKSIKSNVYKVEDAQEEKEAEEGENSQKSIKSNVYEVKDAQEEKEAEGNDAGKILLPAQTGLVKKGTVVAGKIIINEIFPNPNGADLNGEFIELKNIGGQEVNIDGWILKNNETQYVIAKNDFIHTIITAGGFFVLSRDITNIALNNSGDKIELFSREGKKTDNILYKDYAIENISYARIDDKWQWTSAISIGKDNIFVQPNRAPQSVIDARGKAEIFLGSEIIFDASDSFDPDGDKLSYFWKSSEGKEAGDLFFKEKFNAPGEYKISLKVSDSCNNEDISEFKIKVLDNFWQSSNSSADSAEPLRYNDSFENVSISEILPNPEGSDSTGEWIKLFNFEDYPVSLAGWVLDDKDGGSSPYYIPEDVVIEAKSSFLFESAKTGIALNNDGDEARLLNPDGNLASAVKYEKSYEGKVFAYDEATGNWNWGEESQKSKVKKPALSLPKGQKLGEEGKEGEEEAEIKKLEIGNWELEKYIGQEIMIEGYVSAKPGILGVQVFYLTDENEGIEVYCYKKDFPSLEVGDYVSVFGEVSDKDGWRLSINGQEYIYILSFEHPPLAKELDTDFTKSDLHNLISVKGEVLEKQGNNLYIYFVAKEVKVYINEYTGISLKDIKAGMQVQVIGILDYFNEEFRILPRTQEDLQTKNGSILGAQSEVNATVTTTDKFASEFDEEKNNTDNTSVQRRKKIIIFLSVSLAALTAVGWILWKRSARY